VGLDAGIRRRIWSLIKKIQQDGATIFLTTHYIEEAEFLADRVAFIDKGRVVAVDSPAGLMNGLGRWAVDGLTPDGMQTAYFPDREAARTSSMAGNNGFTLRRVNLEDAFLAMTGRKVAANTGIEPVHAHNAHGRHHARTGNTHGGHGKKEHCCKA
jgi:ABC-2 type transport system ATP-binding protein